MTKPKQQPMTLLYNHQGIPKITFTILCFLFITAIKAQFSQTFFYDTISSISREGKIKSGFMDGKYIYLSGASFSPTHPLATVTKMDTSGKVIWTAMDDDNYKPHDASAVELLSEASFCNGTIKSSDKIFTIANNGRYPFDGSLPYEILCLSDANGTVLWKVNLDNKDIIKLADYSSTELLAITGTSSFDYYVINKQTGAITFTKHFGDIASNKPNILVDNNHNILLSYGPYCKKYRDSRLNELLWTSYREYFGSYTPIDKVLQVGDHYIFTGRNNVRSVDTLTGNTTWYTPVQVGYVPGYQGGGYGDPQDIILKDSLVYITWICPYVGSTNLEAGFTLTCINTRNGVIRYNVAYDFDGVPADKIPNNLSFDALDWPIAMCMDDNQQIYITGAYDSADFPGNWGIMKINGKNGKKQYEATITDSRSRRFDNSSGMFIGYLNGMLFNAGNLESTEKIPYYINTKPTLVTFDTSKKYKEQYRINPFYAIRYPSALVSVTPLGTSKMVLFKKVGRSGIIELRTNSNRLLWSKSFTSTGKFVMPMSMAVLGDTAIAASFTTFIQDGITNVLMDKHDSIWFVAFDTLGNTTFSKNIKYKSSYELSPMPFYTDKTGRTNFIFRSTQNNSFAFKGYMLNGNADSLNYVSNYVEVEPYDSDRPAIKVMPLQHYNGDTMIIYQAAIHSSSSGAGWLKSATQQTTGYTGYNFYGFRTLSHFQKIYSALKTGDASFYVMGRDSSGRIRADLYNYRLANPLVWTYNPTITGTAYNADSAATSLYTVSKNSKANQLVITKLNRLTGKLNWTYAKKPSETSMTVTPVDFKYDAANRYLAVGGYLSDTSAPNTGTQYFYLVLDSTGKTVRNVSVSGLSRYDNTINVVNVLPNGTHVYGGTLSTSEWGTAGWYTATCFGNNLTPAVSIVSSDTVVCKGTLVTFIATATLEGDKPKYQWQINGRNVGTNIDTFTTNKLNDKDQVKVILTSNVNCLQTPTATSNVITVTVHPKVSPIISIAGNTLVESGQPVIVTATAKGTGLNPTYQWQDSTYAHSWQTISNSMNTTITYLPAATGDAIRCVMKSSAPCATNNPVVSNQLVFTINTVADSIAKNTTGLIYYPNPVGNMLTIDKLKLTDQWQTLTITSITGNQHPIVKNIQGQTKVVADLGQLATGFYIAVLQRKQGGAAHLKFMKL